MPIFRGIEFDCVHIGRRSIHSCAGMFPRNGTTNARLSSRLLAFPSLHHHVRRDFCTPCSAALFCHQEPEEPSAYARGARTTTTAVDISEPKPTSLKKERARRRRIVRSGDGTGRYFLIKNSAGGQIELGDEVPTENDAMVTAFRTGGTFAVVTEWKTTVDLTDGRPVIKKEAVHPEKSPRTNIGSHDVGRGDPQLHAEKLLAGNTRTSVLPPVPATDSKGVGR
jgi:hypothetical protein